MENELLGNILNNIVNPFLISGHGKSRQRQNRYATKRTTIIRSQKTQINGGG